ncbi:MAG: hypothetical protein ABH869_03295 [Candidatus Omnitrophota bacterium]
MSYGKIKQVYLCVILIVLMYIIKAKKSSWQKILTVAVTCMFLANAVSWAYPVQMNLGVQSIFNPLSRDHIRDIGIIRHFLFCLLKVYGTLDKVPGDVNLHLKKQSLDIDIEIASRDTLNEGPDISRFMVPCMVGKDRYYAYVTGNAKKVDLEKARITVFTEKEFKKIQDQQYIFHPRRAKREEDDILHEQEQDTPLSLVHSTKHAIIKNIPEKISTDALTFLKSFGANPGFLNEAVSFIKDQKISIVPNQMAYSVTIRGEEIQLPLEFTKAHASNNYINIPESVYDVNDALKTYQYRRIVGVPCTTHLIPF